jgi:hypothetical protein
MDHAGMIWRFKLASSSKLSISFVDLRTDMFHPASSIHPSFRIPRNIATQKNIGRLI